MKTAAGRSLSGGKYGKTAGGMTIGQKIGYAVNAYGKIGMNTTQALGAIGSMMGESGPGLDPGAHNENDPGPAGSQGTAQWNGTRLAAGKSWAKKNNRSWNDYRTQIDFSVHELTTTEARTLRRMKEAKTLDQATKTWTLSYERPHKDYTKHKARLQNAKYAANIFGQVKPADMIGVEAPDEASTTESIGQVANDFANDPLGAIVGALTGQVNIGKQIDDALGPVDDVAKSAMKIGKDPVGAIGGIAKALAGDDPDSPMGAIAGLFDPTPGMKLGAIAGGLIGGPQGSLIGSLIGQGLGLMLGAFANPNQQQAAATAESNTGGFLSFEGFGVNDYPEAPAKAVNAESKGYGSSGLSGYGHSVAGSSGQFGGAVSSGSAGLW